jgi:phosphatidylserine decarboxylase
MTSIDKTALAARYENLLAFRNGYLPADIDGMHECLCRLKRRVESEGTQQNKVPKSPAVRALADLIRRNSVVRLYLSEMIDEVNPKIRTVGDVDDLITHLDHIVGIAPEWEDDAKKRNFFPFSSLLAPMMMTQIGEAAFRDQAINDALRTILKEWCYFLDSANSLYVLQETMADGRPGWLSPQAVEEYKLEDFVIPDRKAAHWGWPSFNAFFHREIQACKRPVEEPDNPNVISSPNDGTVFAQQYEVKEQDRFWIKGQPYSLFDMLAGSAYVDRFLRGSVFQSFLSGADYHRLRAPVSGVVRDTEIIEGLMFSNRSRNDSSIGINSQAYETAVNTRGLIFIEHDDPKIGLVCCMPVGITEVSSITITVARGERVSRGDEIAYFSYGGSSMAIIFRRGAVRFTVPAPMIRPGSGDEREPGTPIKAGGKIGVAD